jgi:putative nucleotidyltransferase with HDIG domain
MDRLAKGFAMVVDSKSPFTAGHSARVALYADMIGEQLALTAAHRRHLRRGALLHDIGKLGISNTILDKPGKLTDAEFETVQSHPQLSADILSTIPAFAELVPMAGGHHEKLDGRGYPRKLKGGEISFETRVVAVADIFDALTADRPYRKAMPANEAMRIIADDSGKGLDATCVEALQHALQKMSLAAA